MTFPNVYFWKKKNLVLWFEWNNYLFLGLVSDHTAGSTEDIFGASVSDEDDDAEPIPLFLLNDSSGRPGKSPLLLRGNSSPPKIIKQSLKNFSGLEGVTPGMLSTQDSLEVAQQRVLGTTTSPSPLTSSASLSSAPSTAVTAKRLIHHETSMPVASTSEVSTAVFHKVNANVTTVFVSYKVESVISFFKKIIYMRS